MALTTKKMLRMHLMQEVEMHLFIVLCPLSLQCVLAGRLQALHLQSVLLLLLFTLAKYNLLLAL